MSDEQALTAAEVAQRLARVHQSLHARPGMSEREYGRLEGAADVADLALRLLARVPGAEPPETAEDTEQNNGSDEIADVLPLRRDRRDQEDS